MTRQKVQSIEIKNVSELLSDGRCLFQQVSFSFPLGKTVFIESPPGSGTAELLKIVAGLKQPTFGDILYNGQSINRMTFNEFNKIRLSISYCFDNGGMISDMSIKQNIEFPLKFLNSWRHERSPALLKELVY